MAWPQDAYVGQKVVCVRFNQCWCGCDSNALKINEVYTIKEIVVQDNIVGFLVKEVEISPNHIAFFSHWFRPVVSRPTSISIFTAMLGPRQKETIDG